MAFFKWFKKIEAFQSAETQHKRGPLEAFDFTSLKPATLKARVISSISGFVFKYIILPLLRICQEVLPNPYIPFAKVVVVTRDEDVRAILSDAEAFGVPYGPEMKVLGNGTTFGLGLDGPDHARQNLIMRDVMIGEGAKFRTRDIETVLDLTKKFATALIENSNGRIDVFTDYFTRVATETGARYLGLETNDPVAFAQWSLAVSGLLFGDPTGDAKTRAVALNGGKRLCLLIDDCIQRTQSNFRAHPNTLGRDKTILDRLVKLQIDRETSDDPISNGEVRAIMLGLVTGFIPTNTLAAFKMLGQILARAPIFEKAKACASAPNRDDMKAIIKETARLDSPLAPGQWRVARKDTVIAPGTSRARRVSKGTVVLASTQTALRDRRRFASPDKFSTDRGDVWGDLMFGGGPHACLGSHMAIEQLTDLFMILFAQPSLRPAKGKLGRVEMTGVFPVRLDMVFDSPSSTQSMFMIIAPVQANISKADLDAELAKLGHGATISDTAKAAFDDTEIVHFASMSTVTSNRGLDIIIELSVDGTIDAALAIIADKAGSILRPILQYSDFRDGDDIAAVLKRYLVTLHSKPWGATGLDYPGTGEFSIDAIKTQEAFAKLTEEILADYLDEEVGKGSQPMRALTYVRRIISQDRFQALKTKSASTRLMERAHEKGFDAYSLKPSRATLKIADYKTPTYRGALWNFTKSSEGLFLVIPALTLLLCFGYSLLGVVEPAHVINCPAFVFKNPLIPQLRACHFEFGNLALAYLGWLAIFLGTLLAFALTVGIFLGLAILYLRCKETRDVADQSEASVQQIVDLGTTEDHPDYAHNHFMALGDFKPGLFRKLVHAFALWGIKMIIIFYYRPGFVINMGTIHYARWFRLPGTDRSIFFSNYDGSWDSYLEDFITRARWGQTAAWSNWQGFPETKYLIFKGAQDGDRFKRWVRTKQQIVPFWYSRFPHLTTDQIRNNALIHHGIARAQTDSEAREWLRCFGSMPRVANQIESDEVQSIVFRGMGDLKYSCCLILKLPEVKGNALGYWLKALCGREVNYGSNTPRSQLIAPVASILFEDDRFAQGKQAKLRPSLRVTFGDRQIMGEEAQLTGLGIASHKATADEAADRLGDQQAGQSQFVNLGRRATFLAWSAEGFRKFHTVAGNLQDLPDAFPPAFKIGMGQRSRILGDVDAGSPENWRWSDTAQSSKTGEAGISAEAALIFYADTPQDLSAMKLAHSTLVTAFGGKVMSETDCGPAWPDDPALKDHEHFGYRDGISQPVIRGTERFSKGVPQRDIIEPGEIILGYASNQGFFPPSPLVRAEDDLGGDLPVPTKLELSRFPDFGVERAGAMPRDFGRNGSFIVIRELRQDVKQFECFVKRKADELEHKNANNQTAYPNLRDLAGQKPNEDWIKAKLMGRWPDGRPLVGNPVAKKEPPSNVEDGSTENAVRALAQFRAERDNDFSYGIDDPQGFACPFGAHIRRANPRDSKEPGDTWEQAITNRHRLLRRGRSYTRIDENGEQEKGLLFVAICADLERQFEFVQQTWINSPNFHGLSNEPDPIIGSITAANAQKSASFTIPTPAGPVKLTGMETFVKTRAGGYFFLPSRSALTFLKERAFVSVSD